MYEVGGLVNFSTKCAKFRDKNLEMAKLARNYLFQVGVLVMLDELQRKWDIHNNNG